MGGRELTLATRHKRISDYLTERAEGADGKTVWDNTARICEQLELTPTEFHVSVQYLEKHGFVEPIRQPMGDGSRIRYAGFRVLREFRAPPCTGRSNGSVITRPIMPRRPQTPMLDELAAALELLDGVKHDGVSVAVSALLREALQLRAWAEQVGGND